MTEEPEGSFGGHEDPDRQHLTMETVDRDAVGRVAGVAQLDAIRAVFNHGMVSPHYVFDEDLPATWTQHAGIGFDTHSLGLGESGHLSVLATFFAHFDRTWVGLGPEEYERPTDREVDVQIEVSYLLTYQLDGDVEEADLEHFAYLNGTFSSWPYWRQHAQSACSDLGLTPRLVVPVFRLPKL